MRNLTDTTLDLGKQKDCPAEGYHVEVLFGFSGEAGVIEVDATIGIRVGPDGKVVSPGNLGAGLAGFGASFDHDALGATNDAVSIAVEAGVELGASIGKMSMVNLRLEKTDTCCP